MQEIARQYVQCVFLQKGFNLLKTSQGAAQCRTHRTTVLWVRLLLQLLLVNSSTNQNLAYKVSFESHALESEYESPKQFFK
jgi:hypothetical protein